MAQVFWPLAQRLTRCAINAPQGVHTMIASSLQNHQSCCYNPHAEPSLHRQAGHVHSLSYSAVPRKPALTVGPVWMQVDSVAGRKTAA